MADFCQVRIKPAKEDPRDPSVGEIAEGHGPDRRTAHNVEPQRRSSVARLMRRGLVVRLRIEKETLSNERSFLRRNMRMIVRRVARNHIPDSADHKANDCAEP